MTKKKQKDKEYPVWSFRISDEVYQDLQKLKAEKGKSWNLLFKEILYGQKNSTNS